MVRTVQQQSSCHAALCAIGTTMREAGSERAFRQVDFDAVMAVQVGLLPEHAPPFQPPKTESLAGVAARTTVTPNA